MSTIVSSDRFSTNAPVAIGLEPIKLKSVQPGSLEISAPDFLFQMTAAVTKYEPDLASGQIRITAVIDGGVHLTLSLHGESIEQGAAFGVENFSVEIEVMDLRPRAEFVASTVWAVLHESESVNFHIPENEYELESALELPLLEISKMLQARQRAYRLMVIERATGKQFRLPSSFSRGDIEEIAFTYHAIADRSFVWQIGLLEVDSLAIPENLAVLFPGHEPLRYESSPLPVIKTILGEPISLGNSTMVIEDFFIQNADEVKRELEKGDGHPVKFLVGSRNYQATFNFPEAPRLPDSPWDSKILELIDLESKLDARLCERYNALAASTLEGLTDEQKAAVTARPELDWGSFLTSDTDEEKS